MRCRLASAARVLSFLSLVVLTSHSFILANAAAVVESPAATGTDVSVPNEPTLPTTTSTSVAHTTSTPAPPTSVSDTPTSPPSHTTSSTLPHTTSSTTPSQTSSQTPQTSTSTSAASTESTTSTTSSSSSSSSSRSSTVTSAPSETTLSVSAGTNPLFTGASYKQISTTLSVGLPTDNPSPNATDTANAASAASGNSFFSNKGAVAGTFTVVAIVALILLFTVVRWVMKRQRRRRDEEDDAYFEKYQEQDSATGNHNHYTTNLGGLGESAVDVTVPASTDAYPDRNVHYGAGAYDQAQYDQTQYEQAYDYPQGTAYAAASQGGQYQYNGYAGQQQAASRTSPGPHPFADPHNSLRPSAAPPVNQPYAQSVDYYYGASSEGSHAR
ncbi:hypothetical protein C8Q75DRAFT_729721 [Abortiporus biennis]|nr:hypothetical protein C8Q75DRAFT_729721 [Abortiporus biennis]